MDFLFRLLMFVGGGILAVAGFFGMAAMFLSIPMIGIAGMMSGVEVSFGASIGFGFGFFVIFLVGIFLMKSAFSGN